MLATRWRSWGARLGLVSFTAMGGAIAVFGDCVLAQIAPDGTLGAESSVVAPNVDIDGLPSDQIDGGAKRGANLFHSFREFNIDEGRGAYFTNPAGIENILSRVTGSNPSNILGTLGITGGNANLFLMNPNGIIFGLSSSLNVNGSFVGTTANAIGLASGDIFSANPVEPLPTQLLNVNPSAFFFNQITAQPITSQARLQIPAAQSLLLVSGNLQLNGGQLLAPGGRVELGGVAGTGNVGLSVNGSEMSLSFPVGVQRADISLTNGTEVNVRASGGGSIAINAQNLNLVGKKYITGGYSVRAGFYWLSGGGC